MDQKDKTIMTITITWPDADGKLVETDFIDRWAFSKMLHTTPRNFKLTHRAKDFFPKPLHFGRRQLWKPSWAIEYMQALEKDARTHCA